MCSSHCCVTSYRKTEWLKEANIVSQLLRVRNPGLAELGVELRHFTRFEARARAASAGGALAVGSSSLPRGVSTGRCLKTRQRAPQSDDAREQVSPPGKLCCHHLSWEDTSILPAVSWDHTDRPWCSVGGGHAVRRGPVFRRWGSPVLLEPAVCQGSCPECLTQPTWQGDRMAGRAGTRSPGLWGQVCWDHGRHAVLR